MPTDRAALVAAATAARHAWRDAYMKRSEANATDAYAVYVKACEELEEHKRNHPTTEPTQ